MISGKWTDDDVRFLRENYPKLGKLACATILHRKEWAIRYKASALGLKIDQTSDHFREWQARAARSHIGKKRPDQVEVILRSHAQGKMIKTPEQLKAMGERVRRQWKEKGHPRGALGMKHTAEAKKKMSDSSKKTWSERIGDERSAAAIKAQKTKIANGRTIHPHGSWKQSWREIGGQRIFCRSRWEANYARFLEWQRLRGDIAKWEHEPETFWFDGIRRGCVSYLPDFRITYNDGAVEYHEVKGWMDERSKTKIKRMAKYHPSVKLVVVDSKSYKKLAALICTTIPGWE